MIRPTPSPTRWTGLDPTAGPEGRAGDLLRAARRPPLPGPAAMARVQGVLTAPPRRPFPWFKLVLVASSLLVSWQVGVAVVARGLPVLQALRERLATPAPATVSAPPRLARATARPPPVPEVPALSPAPVVLVPSPPAPPSRASATPRPLPPVPSVAPAAPVPPAKGALALEAEALAPAFDALRAGQPAAALDTLASYRRGYPSGVLGGQADTAELEALLAVGDDRRALGLLDRLQSRAFAGLPDPDRLRALRGELLFRQGRVTEALATFEALANASGEARERARYGRAAALLALGRTADGRAALTRYLAEYPAGRFAAEVGRALGAP